MSNLVGETFNREECEEKLREKIGDKPFLNTLEQIRREQRTRLDQIENEFYSQTNESLVKSKPPLPKSNSNASKRSSSPEFISSSSAGGAGERQSRPQYTKSMNVVRRHDDEIAFCPHRTLVDGQTRTIRDFSNDHIDRKLRSLWKEFGLDQYVEEKRNKTRSTSASWSGRITVPEPFLLTESSDMENVHRRKCLDHVELEKLRKNLEEELTLQKRFKANPIPAHIHIPLYDRLREEEKRRREENFQSTKNFLSSISKPFEFDAREKTKIILRRHSFSLGDIIRTGRQFKAKPVPSFYQKKSEQNEKIKENEISRTIQKKIRANELLEQSRLPFSSSKSKNLRRSLSTNDLANLNYEEFPFRPKINGYYVPKFDKLHSKFVRTMEEKKRTRSPTRCQPFLLYTNLIPSKKDRILHEIQNEAEIRHAKSRQIKGKPIPSRSAPIVSVSMNSDKSESIPTKMTESQRLRESLGKKKRHEQTLKSQSIENLQRSKSVRERRVREELRQRTQLKEKQILQKAQRDDKIRTVRQEIRSQEESYAKKLEEMHERVRQRPLLAEITAKDAALKKLEKKFKKALDIAEVSEAELLRQQKKN